MKATLLATTEYAWRPIRERFFNSSGIWMEPEQAAWLLALLKMSPDTPDLFPNGKWASIQQLETTVEHEAGCCVQGSFVPVADGEEEAESND